MCPLLSTLSSVLSASSHLAPRSPDWHRRMARRANKHPNPPTRNRTDGIPEIATRTFVGQGSRELAYLLAELQESSLDAYTQLVSSGILDFFKFQGTSRRSS